MPGLENTRLFISLTAGAGTVCMSLSSSSPTLTGWRRWLRTHAYEWMTFKSIVIHSTNLLSVDLFSFWCIRKKRRDLANGSSISLCIAQRIWMWDWWSYRIKELSLREKNFGRLYHSQLEETLECLCPLSPTGGGQRAQNYGVHAWIGFLLRDQRIKRTLSWESNLGIISLIVDYYSKKEFILDCSSYSYFLEK
jgi:hypothetical protein